MRRFEDYTRQERVQLILTDPAVYMALLESDHLYLLLDGIAKTKKASRE